MACGGLKLSEAKIDQRLLGNHHAVRAVDFAFEVRKAAAGIPLKDGNIVSVKVGVHSGEVIAGVVGETKP